MSSNALNWAKNVTVGSAAKKAILLVLADYCDEEWSCFPSQARIAEEAEVGERTVRRILAEWQESGIIRRERRPSKDGSGRSSDRIFIQPATLAARNPERLAFQAAMRAVQPATGDSSTGQALAGEPPVEPLEQNLPLTVPETQTLEEEFDEWWDGIWAKKSVGAARVAYKRARKKASRKELFLARDTYPKLMRAQGRDPKYWKQPAAWLNQECWLDEEPDHQINPFEGPEMRYA